MKINPGHVTPLRILKEVLWCIMIGALAGVTCPYLGGGGL